MKNECLKLEKLPSLRPPSNIFISTIPAIGGFSWFQIWATLVIILPEIPAAMISVAPVFTGASYVPFTCQTEEDLSQALEEGPSSMRGHQIYSGMDPLLCSLNCTRRVAQGSPFSSVVQEVGLCHDLVLQS
jgi:hypothetical protein